MRKVLVGMAMLASVGLIAQTAMSATLTPVQYSHKKDKKDDGGSKGDKKGDKKGGGDEGRRDGRDRDDFGRHRGGHCHWERFRHRWEWVCGHRRDRDDDRGRRY